MEHHRNVTRNVFVLACLLAASVVLAPTASNAQEARAPEDGTDTGIVQGEWPARLRPVSLRLDDGTVAQALQTSAEQAGIGLVLEDVAAASARRLTLRLQKRPAREVIELLLRSGGLRARVEGGILFVQGPPPPVTEPAPAPAPPAVPPTGEAGKDEAPADDNARMEQDEDSTRAEVLLGPGGLSVKARKGERRHKKMRGGNRDERVQVGKSLRIEAGEEVDSAVAVGGSLTVAGHVREDAVAVGGSVTLEPGATVDGDAVAVGGSVTLEPGAELGGDRVGIGGPLGSLISGVAGGFDGDDVPWGALVLLHTLAKLMRVAVLFVIGLLIVSFAPRRYARIREYMTARPGKSALAGLIILLATVPLCVLFAVTVIGIPLIPFLLLLLLALIVFGLTAFLTWLGDKVPLFKGRKTPVAALAIGVAMFFLVSLVPLVGSAVLTVFSFFGAGAAFLTKLGAAPKDQDLPLPAEPAGA
jgi:hypothetical protein